MDYLFSFFGSFPVIIVLVVIFVQLSSLKKRVSALEIEKDTVSLLKNKTVSLDASLKEAVHSSTLSEDVDEPKHESRRSHTDVLTSNEPDWEVSLIAWLKEDWMLKFGAMFLLGGIGWFVTYSFMQNWIGPIGRITLGFILGSSVLVYGWYKLRDILFRRQATVFFILGAAIIFLTTFAARSLYEFFTPASAVMIMFLTSAFISISGVRYSTPSLPLAGLLMAGIAPLLTHSSNNNYIFLFAYLLVVVIGSNVIAFFSGRRETILGGFILISFYSMPYLSSWNMMNADKNVMMTFAYLFTSVFFVTTLVSLMRSTFITQLKTRALDMILIAGTGLYLVMWVISAAPKEWQSLILTAWAFVFMVGAFMVSRIIKEEGVFYSYGSVGIMLLGTATGVQLHGDTLIIAYIFEALAIVVGYQLLTKKVEQLQVLSFLFLIPILMSFEYVMIPVSFYSQGMVILFLLAGILLGMAWYMMFLLSGLLHDTLVYKKVHDTYVAYLVTGSVYVYVLVWKIFHSDVLKLTSDIGTFGSLIIYTIVGLYFYIHGRQQMKKGMKLYGIVLLCFVIAHLLLSDVWSMDLVGKIISFAGIGILFMGTALIGRSSKNKVIAH